MAITFSATPYTTHAAPNPQINYQGKLTDNQGATVTDGLYDMYFSLYTAASGGSPIWSETSSTTVTNGLFSVMLGSTTPLTNVNFNQTLYLGVRIDTDSEMTPRKIIGTVPAAFESFSLGGATSTQYLRSDQADIATELLTFTGGLVSTASSTITNLTTLFATTTNLIINGQLFNNLLGSGLTNSGGALTANISESNLNIAGSPVDGYVLQASSTVAGGFVWVATSTLGFSGGSTISFGTNRQIPFMNSGGTDFAYASDFSFNESTDTLTIGNLTLSNSRIAHTVAATTTIVNNNPFAWTLATSTGGLPLLRVDTTSGSEQVFIGGNDLTLGNPSGTGDAAFQFAGDSNAWTIGYESSDKSFRIASSTELETNVMLTITKSGHIGIGTTTPAYDLDIYGNIRIDGNIYDTHGSPGVNGYVLQATTDGIAWVATSSLGIVGGGASVSFGTNGQIPFMNSGGTDFAYSNGFSFDDSTDTLTIGGLALSDALTVHTSTSITVIPDGVANAWVIATSTDGVPLFSISTDGSTEVSFGLPGGNVLIGSVGSASNLVFEESSLISGQGENTITFGETGDIFNFAVNLGIGTATPAYALDIYGDVRLDGHLFDSTGASGTVGYVLQTTANGVEWVATSSLGIGGGGGSSVSFGTNGQIPFMNSGGTDFQYAAALVFDGTNLGIGTSTPSHTLTVLETVADAQLRIAYDGTRYAHFQIDSVGDLLIDASGSDIYIPSNNLWICESGSCPSITASSTEGYAIVENGIYFGNGFKIDQITGTTTELGVYNASGSVIIIFEQE